MLRIECLCCVLVGEQNQILFRIQVSIDACSVNEVEGEQKDCHKDREVHVRDGSGEIP